MRLAFLLAIVLTSGANAQTSPADSNVACAERLKIPTYPALANTARIEGMITATIRLSSDRAPAATASPGQPMLSSAVERAISESKFRTDCGGKTVTLIFEFKLGADGSDEKHFFQPPNRFLILSKPVRIETNP
jgi:hypothetical protein